MSLPPPPGFGAFAATFTEVNSARNAVITMGCAVSGAATAAGTLSNVSASLFGAGCLMPLTALGDTWELTNEYCLINQAGVLTSAALALTTPGTGGHSVVTPQVSVVMNKHTVLAGRQYRGRMAIPSGYLLEGDVDEAGVITPANVTAFNAGAVVSLAAAVTNGVRFHLLHSVPASGIVPAPTPITSMICSPLVGTQRKRLRR